MKLSIIIVSYNTAQLTTQCLAAVLLSLESFPGLLEATEVIVVDNNSSDNSVAAIKDFSKTHPKLQLRLLPQQTNLGFGRANNIGIAKSSGELLLFLNSDTVCQVQSIPLLLEAFQAHPLQQPTADLSSYRHKLDRLGVVSAQLLNVDGSMQPQGGSFPTLVSLACHMLMLDDLPLVGRWLPSTQHTGRRQTTPQSRMYQQDWVAATAMMVRRALIDEVGHFDPDIFMYGEDVELCIRSRNHHWDIAIEPSALVMHYGSASSSSATAITGELMSYLYIWRKHKPHWQRPYAKGLLLLGCQLRSWLFGTILQNQEKAKIYQAAIKEVRSQ